MSQLPAERRRPPVSTLIALTIIIILGIFTVLGAVTVFQLPSPATDEAKKTRLLYEPVLVISFIVFYAVTSAIIWAIFRYKRQSEDEMPEQIHGSSVLEATWTIIPIIILVALFIPAVILVLDLKTPPAEADVDVHVEAIGHQWWWEFDYADNGIKVQTTPPDYANLDPPKLVLPVDQEVVIKVRSTDVVHSFSAPNTLYKIQAIPGNINEMHLKFEKTGEFHGQCYQFCGLRHANMRFTIEVLSKEDYDAWVAENQSAQGIVNPAGLAATSKD